MAKTYEAIEKDTGKRFRVGFGHPQSVGIAKADKLEEYFHAYIEAHPEKEKVSGFRMFFSGCETQPDLPFAEFMQPNAREVPNAADIHGAFSTLLGISPKEYKLILERYVWGGLPANAPGLLTIYDAWLNIYYTGEEQYHVICAVNACMEDGFGERSDRGRWQALAALTEHETWGALLFSIVLTNMDTQRALKYLCNMYMNNPGFVNPWNVHKVKCLQDTMKKRYERKTKDRIPNNSVISMFMECVFTQPVEEFEMPNGAEIVKVIGTHEAKRRAEGKTPNESVLALMQRADKNTENVIAEEIRIGKDIAIRRRICITKQQHSLLSYCLHKAVQMYDPDRESTCGVEIEVNMHEYAMHLNRSGNKEAVAALKREVKQATDAMKFMCIDYIKYGKDKRQYTGWTHVIDDAHEYPHGYRIILSYRMYELARFSAPFVRDLLGYKDMYTFSIGYYLSTMAQNNKCSGKQMIDSVTVETLMKRIGIEEDAYEDKQHSGRFLDTILNSMNKLSSIGLSYRLTEKKDCKRLPLSKPINKYTTREKKKLIIEFTFTSLDPETPEKESMKK